MEELSSQELAAAIHETTNALTVILGWIERARLASPDNEDALGALARAGRYTRDARAAMRRAIGAKLPPRPPETALSLASRATEDLSMEAKRGQVALVLDVDSSCEARLVPQPDTAWQILTNLLLNALAVTPAGGEVTLEVEPVSQAGVDPPVPLVFRVSDDGPGVPEDLRETLFTAAVSRRKGGAGIGLRHAHNLAAECGGELRLAATDDDLAPSIAAMSEHANGATFELRWPTAEGMTEERATTGQPLESKANLAGARILLLEDDVRVIELLELSLGARGAEVTSVRSAEELDTELDTGSYDVMLVDLSPLSIEEGEPTGLEHAVQKARRENPGIDVVVISGSVAVRPRNDVIWVRKPFEPGELVNAILKGHDGSGQTS